ncbi:MAG: tetratricopeptide repeat protein, partial [Bacteroidia bacterium]|nr:tetratricopeptide repeat protein [Bacteroidia bacterium]
MLRKSCLYLLLLLFSFGEGYGQDQHKIDSLTHLLQTTIQDTTKVSALIGLSGIYYLSYPDTALVFCEKALLIAEKANIKEALAECYGNLAFFAEQKGDISKALEYNFKSVEIFEELIKEKNLSENLDKKGLATVYNNIGRIYDDQGEIEKGLEYFFLSLKIREEIKDKIGMAESYHNIGYVLCELDSLAEGMRYLELGLGLKKESGYKAGVSVTTSLIGGWHLRYGKVEDALESGLEALAVAREVGHVQYMKRAAKLLSEIYKKQSKFEDALAMYELEIQMRDSILNEENTKATIRQQMKYEYEKEQIRKDHETKEKTRIEAEATSRRNQLHYTGIAICLLLIASLVAMLGFIKVSPKAAEGIIFIAFLIFFEFILVWLDPYIEQWTGGAPGYKLLFNALLAGCIFPLHQFFEGKLQKRLVKVEQKKLSKTRPPTGGGVKLLMFLGLVLSHSFLFGQSSGVDSLNKELQNPDLPNTTKAKILVEITELLYLQYPDTMIPLCQKAIEIVDKNLPHANPQEKISFLDTKASALNNIGYIYWQQGDIENGLEYYFESMGILEEFFLPEIQKKWKENLDDRTFLKSEKLFKKGLAYAYNNIGYIYEKQGEIDKGLEYSFLSLNIREEIKDKNGMAMS